MSDRRAGRDVQWCSAGPRARLSAGRVRDYPDRGSGYQGCMSSSRGKDVEVTVCVAAVLPFFLKNHVQAFQY